MPTPKKLSIAFLYDDSLDSDFGVTQNVKLLGEWLVGRGHKVSYLVGQTKTKKWAGAKVYSLARNININFGGNRLSMPLVSHKSQLEQALIEASPDVIHVTVPYSPLMAQRVIKLADDGVAVVGAFHILPSHRLSVIGTYLLRPVYGKSLKRIDSMNATSPAAALFARQALGVKTVVIPNPVDMRKFKPRARNKPIPGHIVFLGRLVKRKGVAELLKAFKLIATDFPGARLSIAGDGKERSNLEKLAKRLGIDGRVKFLGYIDESDKPSLLASAEIACYPSFYGESFGIVLTEAMAAGSGVVVGGNNPGYRSVLGAQVETLIGAPSPEIFSECLLRILKDNALAKKLHVRQQQDVRQYDINVVGELLLADYRLAIATRTQNRHN